MFGARTRKMILAAAMALLTVILCSCGPIVTAELPGEKVLKKDVMDYLRSFVGNDVQLYTLKVDQREYDEQAGTLDYQCTANFAWDEFNGENENRIAAQYALADGSWALASIRSDIDPASAGERMIMRGLFTELPELPDAVLAAFAGADTVPSDALFDFTTELEGKAYRFPCGFAAFALNGWKIDENSGVTALHTIPAQSYISLGMVNGDAAVTLYLFNRTDGAVYVGQGECAGVAVSPQGASAVLAGGITGQSAAEDVIAAYGIPDAEETTAGGRKLTYLAAVNSRVSFLFGAGGTTIDVFTLSEQTEQLKRAALFDTYAFGFALDGMDYTLPVRLDTMLGNGWEAAGGTDLGDVLSWFETKELTLIKDGQSVDVTLRNPSMGDLRLYAASVAGITLGQNGAAYTLVEVNGAGRTELAFGPSAESVVAALGQPSRTDAAGDAQMLTYAADNGRYLRVTVGGGTAIAQLQSYETDDTGSKALQSFALNVSLGSNSYTLPAAASEFKDKMWMPDCGWLQPVKAGSFLRAVLEDRRTEEIAVWFANTGDETVNAQACAAVGLYAGPGSGDIIIGRSLGIGLPVADVFDLFGIPAHDIQDGGARYLIYGTSASRFLCVRCTDDVVDALWIFCFTD